ncbi:Ldh family oxidoreductase [Pseudomonas putida]|uniref:Ldh family oxidoreductase n=1 Tax=Pseudomonas putida TaxID=303 RepID=A0A7D5VW78_PSEPU|nr:Ldh family oxidoreductase [Pseudomonas putida]QLJ12608.1 Ldh family oxidoreductase [Pseudomonas putida]
MSDNTQQMVHMTLDEVFGFAHRVLLHQGYSDAHADAIARVITAGQRDECHSHGLYRLLVCSKSLREGKVSATAVPVVKERSSGIVNVDAQYGFSLLAFETGMPILLEKARTNGVAALAINNCYHFSALWPEVEAIAEAGLCAMALTPSHSWVAPAGGTKPVFGTNPIAFAWPRKEGEPYVFDFATSAIARGDIELHRREGKEIPLGWAVDSDGNPTTDPTAALSGAMLTFGGHKGSALSAMVELMAAALIGDMTSQQSLEYDDNVGASPCHGELILAFDPKVFMGADKAASDNRDEEMFKSIEAQGARLPSQRRFEARKRSLANGVFIPQPLYNDLCKLLD